MAHPVTTKGFLQPTTKAAFDMCIPEMFTKGKESFSANDLQSSRYCINLVQFLLPAKHITSKILQPG